METTLNSRFLQMKQDVSSLSYNPLLNCFDQEDLMKLDDLADKDDFIRDKKKAILKHVSDIVVDYSEKLKSAFDEYNEALTLLRLRAKFPSATKFPEAKVNGEKTPDFTIPFVEVREGKNIEHKLYAELKSLSFADGNNNYLDTMKQATNAQINIDSQLEKQAKVAFGEFEISPLGKSSKRGLTLSTKHEIVTVIDKIQQNLKEGQFSKGETILIIDMKQIGMQSGYIETSIPIFQDFQLKSSVSGLLWNVAFGKHGHLVFKPIEFEGKENIEGELGRDGILIANQWVKAICFVTYALGENAPKVVGMIRHEESSDAVISFMHSFCDFVNDDKNTYGWELHEESTE